MILDSGVVSFFYTFASFVEVLYPVSRRLGFGMLAHMQQVKCSVQGDGSSSTKATNSNKVLELYLAVLTTDCIPADLSWSKSCAKCGGSLIIPYQSTVHIPDTTSAPR